MSYEVGDFAKPVTRSGSQEITNNTYGLNHMQTPLAVPMNREHYGLTFFTRPQLNFQTDNLRMIRKFARLLNTDSMSYQRAIRCMLDPRLQYGMPGASGENAAPLSCALVDPQQAFLPILTNSLLNISGWPSLKMDFHTTKAGIMKEEHSVVDSYAPDYSAYDLTANFRNSEGNPIISMFDYWQHYMGHCRIGEMSPYLDFITENEMDYCTRIYRITLDRTKTKVVSMACTGASMPAGNPVGEKFDYNSEKPYNDANAEISIPFHCNGFVYDDDVIIRWFNETVGIFHPGMRGANPNGTMMKIPFRYLPIFNCRGYPRINPDNYHMEWWIDALTFTAKLGAYGTLDKALDGALGFNY